MPDELTHQSDTRGGARLVDRVAAVQLVLAARGLNTQNVRLLDMIEWLIGDLDVEAQGTYPTRLFVEAIRETDR